MEELVEVEEIGERIAGSVISFFDDPKNNEIIGALEQAGLQLELEKAHDEGNVSEKLEDKTFVISGKFSDYSRDELKELVEKNGGRNAGSVSSKTSYIIAGENMGPEKLKKAEALEIPVISVEDFMEMIKD